MKHFFFGAAFGLGLLACCSTPIPADANGVSPENLHRALVSASAGLEKLRPRLEEVVAIDTRTALLKSSMLDEYYSIQNVISKALTGNK